MATIIDIAERAGVSKTLVSRVINNQSGVSPEKRQLILDAIKELNYRPNRIAQSLVRMKTGIIGVILDSVADPYFGEFISGVDSELENSDYKVVYCSGRNNSALKEEYIQFFTSGVTDGFILYGSDLDDSGLISDHIKASFPMVIVEHEVDDDNVDNVTVNNAHGSELAVELLASKGCERIAHITGSMQKQISDYRLAGYLAGIEKLGYEAQVIPSGDFTVKSGYQATKALFTSLDRSDWPDGIYYSADVNAFGGMKALLEMGIEIPQEVKIVGYDDDQPYNYSLLDLPPLTTLRQPLKELGAASVRFLLEQLETTGSRRQHLQINPVLIERQTT